MYGWHQEGVSKAAEFRPDIVFLDLGMPKMDGFESARRLRELPEGDKTTLIALTGWGQERDLERTRKAGFNQHLLKPLDPGSLEHLLAGHAG